jgi:hypothetical protein
MRADAAWIAPLDTLSRTMIGSQNEQSPKRLSLLGLFKSAQWDAALRH